MKRRDFIKSSVAGCLALNNLPSMAQAEMVLKRKIPSSGELLPSIGLGTWQSFDVSNNQSVRDPLKEVLKILLKYGGSVVDSSPMYGRSEKVVGELSDELNINEQLFCATKVWTNGEKAGVDQMNRSIDLMRKKPLDLMQVHNLQDWQTHLKTMRKWKDEGKVRYIGITHYVASSFPAMEKIMKSEPIDFIQLNYSMGDRKAEESILPLAKDKGIATLINRPYQAGSLFRSVKGKELPAWASELGIKSWGQFFLKYLLSNAAVTCVIPGTSKPHHMLDNMRAGLGRLPSTEERKEMIAFLNS